MNHSIRLLLTYGAELGATAALIAASKLKPYLKKSEAFRLYGRANVEHWINTRAVTPRKDGDHSAAWRIDRLEIAAHAIAIQIQHTCDHDSNQDGMPSSCPTISSKQSSPSAQTRK